MPTNKNPLYTCVWLRSVPYSYKFSQASLWTSSTAFSILRHRNAVSKSGKKSRSILLSDHTRSPDFWALTTTRQICWSFPRHFKLSMSWSLSCKRHSEISLAMLVLALVASITAHSQLHDKLWAIFYTSWEPGWAGNTGDYSILVFSKLVLLNFDVRGAPWLTSICVSKRECPVLSNLIQAITGRHINQRIFKTTVHSLDDVDEGTNLVCTTVDAFDPRSMSLHSLCLVIAIYKCCGKRFWTDIENSKFAHVCTVQAVWDCNSRLWARPFHTKKAAKVLWN